MIGYFSRESSTGTVRSIDPRTPRESATKHPTPHLLPAFIFPFQNTSFSIVDDVVLCIWIIITIKLRYVLTAGTGSKGKHPIIRAVACFVTSLPPKWIPLNKGDRTENKNQIYSSEFCHLVKRICHFSLEKEYSLNSWKRVKHLRHFQWNRCYLSVCWSVLLYESSKYFQMLAPILQTLTCMINFMHISS